MEYQKDILTDESILIEAAENIYGKERVEKYGEFQLSIRRTAKIASLITGEIINSEKIFKIMIALKISRISVNTSRDSLIDLCGYASGLADYYKTKGK